MERLKKMKSVGGRLRVLLLEDDSVVGNLVKSLLESEGYEVDWAERISTAKKSLKSGAYQLLVLDVNVPDGNGFDFCKEVRDELDSTPVIFLTSRTEEDNIVKGLSLGANDYVKKPFGKKELLARVKLQIKGKKGELTCGGLKINIDKGSATFQGTPLSLTSTELFILTALVKHAGQDVSREALMREVDPEVELEMRTLDSHVSHLRTKLNKLTGKPLKIAPVYGFGYRLEKK